MKNFLILLLLGGVAATVGFGQDSSGNKEPFSISISTSKSEVRAGEPVWVKATLRNTSGHEINASAVRSHGVDVSYGYDVQEISGKQVERVEKGSMGKHIQSILTRVLKPGEAAEEDTLVSRVYNMSVPGEYMIQLSRSISESPNDGNVKSNKITVTVTP